MVVFFGRVKGGEGRDFSDDGVLETWLDSGEVVNGYFLLERIVR